PFPNFGKAEYFRTRGLTPSRVFCPSGNESPVTRPTAHLRLVCIIPVAIPADFALHAGNSPADDGRGSKITHIFKGTEYGA
ncbi:hypothetical protein, partial [Bradyrhizobium japonicum]|uniref:hypothetical protein n=1 Tax=Bradyrhizobium japonicum TaxID=375 RepID=UPI001AEDEB48